jgi:hypothetical protein
MKHHQYLKKCLNENEDNKRYYIIYMDLKKVFDVFDTINLALKKRREDDLVAYLSANDVEKFLADIRKGV